MISNVIISKIKTSTLCFFSVLSIISQNNCNSKNYPQEQLTRCDSTVKCKKGEVFKIKLLCAAGTGYSWQLNDSLFKPHVEFISQDFQTISSIPGSDGLQTFYFKGKNKGSEIIRFVYVQPFIKPFPQNSEKKSFCIIIH